MVRPTGPPPQTKIHVPTPTVTGGQVVGGGRARFMVIIRGSCPSQDTAAHPSPPKAVSPKKGRAALKIPSTAQDQLSGGPRGVLDRSFGWYLKRRRKRDVSSNGERKKKPSAFQIGMTHERSLGKQGRPRAESELNKRQLSDFAEVIPASVPVGSKRSPSSGWIPQTRRDPKAGLSFLGRFNRASALDCPSRI